MRVSSTLPKKSEMHGGRKLMLRKQMGEEAATQHTAADVSVGAGALAKMKKAHHQAGPAVMSAGNVEN